MPAKKIEMPAFKNESDEADWWASPDGIKFVKQKSAMQAGANALKGSGLVSKLNEKTSVQIAIRLPQADLDQARELAERKGLRYQTFLKMLVHEGLAREAKLGQPTPNSR